MISNNPYRKLLLDSYFLMLTTQMAYGHLAMDICLLDELKILDGYLEDEEYHYDVFSMIKDKGVQRIHRFLKETVVISKALNEANNFLDEEVDEYGDPPMPAFGGEADRKTLLCVLLVYTLQEVNELHILINKICDFNVDPPIKDYTNTDYYDDENVKLIAAFYNKVLEITDEFKEEVMKDE